MPIRPVTVYIDPEDATEFYRRVGDLLKDPAAKEKTPRKRRTPATPGWQDKLDKIFEDNPTADLATREIVDLIAANGMYVPRRSVQHYLADRVVINEETKEQTGFLRREGETPQHIRYRLNPNRS